MVKNTKKKKKMLPSIYTATKVRECKESTSDDANVLNKKRNTRIQNT